MKRRNFIKRVGLTAAATIGVPYLLPSGRLFAATGARKANHVVFCLFAGGVRNLDSIQQKEGNLMPYTLDGTAPVSLNGLQSLPNPTGASLQSQGTLYKEFRLKYGPTGHYNGHTTAMTGVYTDTNLNINSNPQFPTIFELYRKHNSPLNSALNAWWVSNALGPYANLNYSSYAGYGAEYGANFIQPASIISQEGYNAIGNSKVYTSNQMNKVKSMRSFCDAHFNKQFDPSDLGVRNTEQDSLAIENFINDSFQKALSGGFDDPFGIGSNLYNNDMQTMFFAEEVIRRFQPELLVVNMQDVDVCHTNFTQYANNLQKSDYALWHLWETIQNTPGMANDTVLIVMPEHGRNQNGNGLFDIPNNREALDHTNDEMSREIFALILGPPGVVVSNQAISQEKGESIDIVPTIANILGFDQDIPSHLLNGQFLQDAFY